MDDYAPILIASKVHLYQATHQHHQNAKDKLTTLHFKDCLSYTAIILNSIGE
jgi:hypothetical protein